MNNHDQFGDLGQYPDLVAHEIGHLFGLDDAGNPYYSNDGIMVYGGFKLKPISDNDIRTILQYANNALKGQRTETDPDVKILKQEGHSDGDNPIGVKTE